MFVLICWQQWMMNRYVVTSAKITQMGPSYDSFLQMINVARVILSTVISSTDILATVIFGQFTTTCYFVNRHFF